MSDFMESLFNNELTVKEYGQIIAHCQEQLNRLEEKKRLWCITCGKNLAINDFYRECESCINEGEKDETNRIMTEDRD